jgi:hypothetical protein
MKSEQCTVLAFVMGFCGCLMLVILVAIITIAIAK